MSDEIKSLGEILAEEDAKARAKYKAYEESPQFLIDIEAGHASYLLREKEEQAYQDTLTPEDLKAYLNGTLGYDEDEDEDEDEYEEDDDE
tara:strand:+ start:191 stop:460 length:270 start_codon:yes stop_codon:yes gene_type:complete